MHSRQKPLHKLYCVLIALYREDNLLSSIFVSNHAAWLSVYLYHDVFGPGFNPWYRPGVLLCEDRMFSLCLRDFSQGISFSFLPQSKTMHARLPSGLGLPSKSDLHGI